MLFRSLRWVFVTAHGLSPVAGSGGYSLLWCAGFSLGWLVLLRSAGSRCETSVVVARGLSSCGSRALERRLSSCVATRHVGSSRTRARTRVPCIGRWILNHCATREVPQTHVFLEIQGFMLYYMLLCSVIVFLLSLLPKEPLFLLVENGI